MKLPVAWGAHVKIISLGSFVTVVPYILCLKEKVIKMDIEKIPELQGSIIRCTNCGQETLEGKPDEKGEWHYRCQYCTEHADLNAPDPCPKCTCTAHENIIGIIPYSKDTTKAFQEIKHPTRPEVAMFRCLNCSYEWYSPEYEKFLFSKNVVAVIKETVPEK